MIEVKEVLVMARFKNLFRRDEVVVTSSGTLVEEFMIPPFSVLDARSGEWQAKKTHWLSMGIKSELGRGENLLKMSDTILQPDAKKRALAKTYNSGGPGQLQRELKSRASGADKGFQRTRNMGGKPDNPEMAIPGWYNKLKKGMTKEQIIEEWEAKQAHIQTADIKGGTTFRISTNAYRLEGQETTAAQSGTSIFDPVLCEMFYRWFVPKGGKILDCFAGGSVRGIVASKMGYHYLGCDLRKEQVDANKQQAKELCTAKKDIPPGWICCDARDVGNIAAKESQDAVFSCPPYADLERYSDDPRDLSTLKYDEFLPAYEEIIAACAKVLKPNRFAAFVVGEVRDKDGNCYGFVPDTITAFEKAGLKLYNDAILITAVGSLSIRVKKQFNVSRKLGRCHQQILIFLKGDSRKATAAVMGVKS